MPIPPRPEKPLLWNELPNQFDSKQYQAKCREFELPIATGSRWLENWIKRGFIKRVKHGGKGYGIANQYIYHKIDSQVQQINS